MARLPGPDLNGRLAYVPAASYLRNAVGMAAVVYSDVAGTVLADILTHDGTQTPGAAVAGSSLTVDAQSLIPLFWFPDDTDRVYIRLNGGPASRADADYDPRILAASERTVVVFGNGVLAPVVKWRTFTFVCPWAGRLTTIRLYADTAPTGQDLIVDVNVNGTTVWATQANRARVLAGANSGSQTVFNTTTVAVGDLLTFDLDQVGSVVPGSDLTIELTVSTGTP